MAADDISTTNLPAVAWTGDAGGRGLLQDSGKQDKKVRGLRPGSKDKASSPDVDFEPVEHELDSIA